ncbi:MAG: prefoldin subunit alpha [Candidatus Woesearchaeota archaeon]
MEKKELQKKYAEFQLLQQQLQELQKQLQMLEEQLVETAYTQQTLDELKSLPVGSEILVPVSSGIYAKATLGLTDELLVNVGSGAAVMKSVEGTKSMLDSQLDEVQKLRLQLLQVARQVEEQLLSLRKEIIGEG